MNSIDRQLVNAVENDNPIEVTNLLSKGADINRMYFDADKVNILEVAVRHESTQSLPILLRYSPISLNTYLDYDEYFTLLNHVVDGPHSENQYTMAQALLEAGANPRMSCFAGYTPLHNAAMYQNLELITLLLDHHSNPNQMNQSHTSCLGQLIYDFADNGLDNEPQELVENRVIECMRPLLAEHADPNLGNDFSSFTALAAELNFNRVLAVLEETQLYPLHIAASSCQDRTEFINLINRHNLDAINQPDSKGRTPLDIAKKHGNLMTIQVLSQVERVCIRRKNMERNHGKLGHGLPKALSKSCVDITDYLTVKEFSFFTTATNMHKVNPKKRKAVDDCSEGHFSKKIKISNNLS